MPSSATVIDPAANLRTILSRIANARAAAIAPAAETHLIAISKTHDSDRIEPVLKAGHRLFGENRVQEAKAKWPALKERFSGIELHLVGALQSNKVAEAISLFDCIHSLDREKLADAFVSGRTKTGHCPNLFIQVNVGEEAQKAGIAPRQTEEFVRHCRETLKLPIVGLMCIPPAGEEPPPYFALLQKLSSDLSLKFLSMGMSDDFETAIRFGATHIRVGTAIFGERSRAKP
nr:MAG: YggS family pyridoxal phosphate-dependent enzyme [Hyphomicrobiales bacterium]